MKKTISVGSAAWTCGKEYTDEYAERIVQFLRYTREDALCEYASSLRGGVACVVAADFAAGSHHMVRKLCFEDGVEWVARMRLPPIWGDEELSSRAISAAMSSELAAMAFVRQNTDVQVPIVHGYNLDIDNRVGSAFVLMEYVPGSTADVVSRMYPGDHRGSIPTHFREKFWRQLAGIMVRLAAVRLPMIGSIYREGSSPGAFTAGPLVETLSGPYGSAAAFYRDFAPRLGRRLGNGQAGEEGQAALLQGFARVATSSFVPETGAEEEEEHKESRGGFGLANYGLSPSNVLVDAEFNVLAVIDWSAVVALPEAALHQLPQGMGIEAAIPGATEATEAAVREAQAHGRRFAEMVERQALEMADHKESVMPPLTAAGFYSREAVAFRALIDMRRQQDSLNRQWARGLEWLAEHSDEALDGFYAGS
ncbi:hypothetical protein V2A60_006466 [Cordyceps javanica]|uniref:Protein kinase-like domain n=1 Tax=Cordyceps javanica TaxID=43265 RepID=A0A545V7V9_9HYPO|nr:Protein kinase-like domain [Cordyceps javanica]TQW09013.1 Protein kinase-like domain [Cordyceps javanica]